MVIHQHWAMDAIQQPLHDRPGPKTQMAIIKAFWNKTILEGNLKRYKAYFEYYHMETRRLTMGILIGNHAPSMLAATHEDIIWIVCALSTNRRSPKCEMRDVLRERFHVATDSACNQAMDFAIRLWLMLNVLIDDRKRHLSQSPVIQWDGQSTLENFVNYQLPQAVVSQDQAFDRDFNAVNLHRYIGIRFDWISSLSDHLNLEVKGGQRVLKVFTFKQFIYDHLASSENLSPIIPATILNETLLSLHMLFPYWDPQTNTLLVSAGQDFHTQAPFEAPTGLHLSDFNHWRDRLMELHRLYKAPPLGKVQLWKDRRNPLQWWTFWLAAAILVLTLIFGIISSVTGGMQVRIAQQALDLARAQQSHS